MGLLTWQCVVYQAGHLVAERRLPERRGVSGAAEERVKRRLLHSKVAGYTVIAFCFHI